MFYTITILVLLFVGLAGMTAAQVAQRRLLRIVKRHRDELAEHLMVLYVQLPFDKQQRIKQIITRQTRELQAFIRE